MNAPEVGKDFSIFGAIPFSVEDFGRKMIECQEYSKCSQVIN